MRYWQSISRLFRTSSSLYLLIILLFLSWSILPTSGLDCAKAKRDWLTYRYKVMVTGVVSSSYHQTVCPIPEGNSCCDKQMEMDIFAVGEHELSASLASWLIPVAEQMETDSVALDYFFRSDLTEARNRLHEAFSGIYGYNYKVNHAFFFQFFNDLEAYMAGRRGDLGQLVTSFFAQLRTSIVVLMEKAEGAASGEVNSASASNGAAGAPNTQRINCLSEALGKQNAFDLTDVHLKDQFLQVYPPARMLVNSLAATAKLIRIVVEDASKRPECIAAFARFRYCGTYCGGREGPQAEVCPAACDNFMKTCFADAMSSNPSSSLPNVWSQLINAITMTTKRLERTQNFASLNKDLHIFLSEAITYVHQKYASVKPSLLQECKKSGGSSNSNSNSARGYKPSGNSWSFSHRLRRSLDNLTLDAEPILSRTKRQSSYPGAVRQQPDPQSAWGMPPTPIGGRNNQMSPSQLPHGSSSYQSYFQSNRRAGGGGESMGGTNTASATNAPEKLSKWATQLKFFYSGVQELFNRAPQNVCPATTLPNAACWNPQPVFSTSQSKRYVGTVSDLQALTNRLEVMNSQNSGDPEAFELGAQMLAEIKMRNATSFASSSSRSGPSLLHPLGPSSSGQMYGQPPMGSHDPWRTGNGAAMGSYGGDTAGGYAPGGNYQSSYENQRRKYNMIYEAPDHFNEAAEESGYDRAGGPPTLSTPSLHPQTPPPPPRQSSVYPPYDVPSQIGRGADTEGSGFWEPNRSGTVPPILFNPWEAQSVQPVQQLHPTTTTNNPDQQQGSGDDGGDVLPISEAFSRPMEIGRMSTTTSTSLPITMTSTTTRRPTTTTTTSRSVTTTTTTTMTTAAPRVERVNTTLPLSSTLQPSGGFDDDEDFGMQTPVPPSQQSSQVPWGSLGRQPLGRQQFEQETSGTFPLDRGQGEVPPFTPPFSQQGVNQGQGHDLPPPDCSPEAMAGAGSGVDPRCLSGGHMPNGIDGIDIEDEDEGGQDRSSGMEPPTLSQNSSLWDLDYLGSGEAPSEIPDYDGFAPPPTLGTTRSPPSDIDRPYQPPTTSKPQNSLPPLRELPPDIWLPVTELKPGDPRLPDSKLFLPDFPLHRGRPMLEGLRMIQGGSKVRQLFPGDPGT
nr:glypican [Hymenolepis microstoma]